MSSFAYPPPTFTSSTYNPSYFNGSSNLTLSLADSRYWRSDTATPGTTQSGKPLVIDSNSTIAFTAGSRTTNCIKMGTNQLYFDNPSSCFYIDSQTAVGGLVLANNYFNYSSTMLKLTNNQAVYGTMDLKFDLVKSANPNWRFFTGASSSLSISACNTDSGTATGSIFLSNSSSFIGIGTFTALKELHVAGFILGTYAGLFGSNASTGDAQLCVLDGTSGTTAVSMRFGNALSTNNCMTMTWNPVGAGSANNYLQFNPYGISNALTVGCDGRVAVGSAPATAGFYCASTVSQSIDSGGSGVAYFLKSGGLITTIGPLSSIAVGVRSAGAILASNGVYTTSDRRIKKDIVDMDPALDILKINPVLYRYKNQDESVPLQCGYIAQDLIKAGLPHVINFTEQEGLEVEDETVDIKDVQFSVDYSKICVLLHLALKSHQKRIDKLEARMPAQ